MLTSLNSENEQVEAQDVEKEQGPFRCPVCFEATTLRKGEKRVHHFAHKPPYDCNFGKGESEEHLIAKTKIRDLFQSNEFVASARLEHPLADGSRPDVLVVFKNGKQLSVEIQASPQSERKVDQRTNRANRNNATVMWVILFKAKNFNRALNGEVTYCEKSGNYFTNKYLTTKEGERRIARLYFNRPFAWHPEEKTLYVLKLIKKYTWRDGFENNESNISGYKELLKTRYDISARKIRDMNDWICKFKEVEAWHNLPARKILIANDWNEQTINPAQRNAITKKMSSEAWIYSKQQKLLSRFRPASNFDIHHQNIIIETWEWEPPKRKIPKTRREISLNQGIEIWQIMLKNGWIEHDATR